MNIESLYYNLRPFEADYRNKSPLYRVLGETIDHDKLHVKTYQKIRSGGTVAALNAQLEGRRSFS